MPACGGMGTELEEAELTDVRVDRAVAPATQSQQGLRTYAKRTI